MHCYHFLLMLTLFWLLTGCDTDSPPADVYTPANSSASILRSEIDVSLSQIVQRHQLTGDPVKGRELPDIDSPLAQLGMKLFFSKTLSGNLDVACASCHHPLLGGGDNLSLSIGVDAANPDVLGHKRLLQGNRSPGVPRNAPTTFNSGLWQQFMFHDGRVEQLKDGIHTPDVPSPEADPNAGRNLVQAQARFPVTSNHEMRGTNFDAGGTAQSCRDRLAERLGGYGKGVKPLVAEETDYWLEAFRNAYGKPDEMADTLITEQNISQALAEYERSQVFVNNPWNQYLQGDLNAISPAAKQGAMLFFNDYHEGGYACASCHRGDFFTDEQFRYVLIPPIGPGKNNQGGAGSQQDYGRWLVSGRNDDKFRFRTPSLLNVEVTGPWGHNGAYTSLSAIVRHMLNPFQSALAYNPEQLKQPGIQTGQLQQNLREMLGGNTDMAGQEYQEDDVGKLVAFLQTLTDPCVTNPDCLSKWIPSAEQSQQDPQALQLNARFEP